MNLNLRKRAQQDADMRWMIFIKIWREDITPEEVVDTRTAIEAIITEAGGQLHKTYSAIQNEWMGWYLFDEFEHEAWLNVADTLIGFLERSPVAVVVNRFCEIYSEEDGWYDLEHDDELLWTTPEFPKHIRQRYVPDVDLEMFDEDLEP